MDQHHSTQLTLSEKDLFLKELRSITSPSHKKLEETELSKTIISENITFEAYTSYLERMYAYLSSFEKTLFPLLSSCVPDIERRKKAHLIEKDLAVLKSKTGREPVMRSVTLAEPSSLFYALGCMYVIEGSTLGGKVIFRNISQHLALDAEHGASYFYGYGKDTGQMWMSFLETLCHYGIVPEHQPDIFRGADDTFKTMFDLLNS